MRSIRFAAFAHLFLIILAPSAIFPTERATDAIVRLTALRDGLRHTGTGFVFDLREERAFIATAAHVVTGSETVSVEFSAEPTKSFEAKDFRVDPHVDLALLWISDPPSGVKALPISGLVAKVDTDVKVLGFPGRSTHPRIFRTLVSGQEGTRLILSREFRGGSSGSPVLNSQSVVGMITETEAGGARAIPGAELLLALESWLPGLLPKTRSRRMGLIVTNLIGIPVAGIEISRGAQISKPTDKAGFTELELGPGDEAGIAFQIGLTAKPDHDWILATKQVNIPHENESEKVQVLVLRRAEFIVILEQLAEHFDTLQPASRSKIGSE